MALTSSAEITLHLAAGNTIVALASGERHRWATTALELAGFTRRQGDAHRLSLDDRAQAREALTLYQTARDCQAKVTTSERPYLGDIAHVIAERLPGQWDVSIEHYPDGIIPAQLLGWVWEASPVMSALSKYRTSGAAILRDGAGTELLLAERPWDGRYVVAALLPSPDHLHVTGAGPRTVVATHAHAAAADVRSLLLPEFEQLVHLARLREVQEDLDWVREEFEPGTAPAVDLDAALDRFLTHAPYLIAAVRRAGNKPPATRDAVVLDRFEILLAARSPSGDDARSRREPGGTDEAMVVWLELGEDLIDVVRSTTVGPAEEPRPAVATSTLPKPPVAVAASGRSR
ncbi:hypothetical protein ACM01_15925 [Streptomyces viridochromogenes]|uniref:Uncharacterized protein n=1 Tax=Streptomyces viridochromogenes TaxID=1938 RepID=A0A0J8C8A7_STRVR|nr:hypothetical protein [Streptomyces viridochromogenes]KMS74105.1 hypothetical protein ACM01_15925 [Streptomyces viridochromogenes]